MKTKTTEGGNSPVAYCDNCGQEFNASTPHLADCPTGCGGNIQAPLLPTIGNSNILPTCSGKSRAEARKEKLGPVSRAKIAADAAERRARIEAKSARLLELAEGQLNPYGA